MTPRILIVCTRSSSAISAGVENFSFRLLSENNISCLFLTFCLLVPSEQCWSIRHHSPATTSESSDSPETAAVPTDDCCEVCLVAPRQGFTLVRRGHARFCDSCVLGVADLDSGCPGVSSLPIHTAMGVLAGTVALMLFASVVSNVCFVAKRCVLEQKLLLTAL